MLDRLRRLLGRKPAPTRPAPAAPQQRAVVGEAPPYGGARDHVGGARISYRPDRDGDPDPGEVVWCWVPFADDPGRGKDRPVIVMGHVEYFPELLVVQLSSQERHRGEPGWIGVGTGRWDAKRRDSYADVKRPLAVAITAVRREGGTLPKDRFDEVAAELRHRYGYH